MNNDFKHTWTNDFFNYFKSNINNLKKAKNLVNNDQVNILKIEDTVVLAIVNENNNEYKIAIKFKSFSDKEKEFIKKRITESYEISASLLNNEIPKNFITELSSNRISLVPKKDSDVVSDCDCNIKISPCRHTLAVILLLSEKIDKNPFILFKLYGFDIINEIEFFNDYTGFLKPIKTLKDIIKEDTEINFIEDYDELKNIEKEFNKIPNLKKFIFDLLREKAYETDIIEYKNFLKYLYKLISSTSKKVLNYNFHFGNDYKHAIILNNNKKEYIEFKNKEDYFKKIFNQKWNNPSSWTEFKININDHEIESITTGTKTPFCEKNEDLLPILLGFMIEIENSDINELHYNIQFLNIMKKFALSITQKYAYIPDLYKNEKNEIKIRGIPNYNNEIINNIILKLSKLVPDDLLTYNNKKISKKEVINILVYLFIETIILDKLNINNSTSPLNILIKNKFHNQNYLKNVINLIINYFSLHKIQNKNYDTYLVVKEKDSMFSINLKIKLSDNKMYNLEEIFKSTNELKYEILVDCQLINSFLINWKISLDKNYWIDFESFNKLYENIFPLLENIGVKFILPNLFEKVKKPKIKINLKEDIKSSISFADISKFDWKIAVGETEFTIEEFEKLVEESKNFIKINDEFIILNTDENLRFLEKYKKLEKNLNKNEMLQLLLSSKLNEEISMDDKISSFLNDITTYKEINVPQSVNANLRDYQKTGFSWLVQNIKAGFGSILADDMGLGKTLQVLTTISYLKENDMITDTILIIAPTSLLTNWQKEIEKFTPSLTSFIYHGPNREYPKEKYDIILTSFGIIRQDVEILSKMKWYLVVVDEAQNIKNPKSLQTLAIKVLKSDYKIALTGTPVENNLSEYWSIFDFTNPDYLGNQNQFKKQFINPIENSDNEIILEQFKIISSPFVLRRMKTDKNILKDLPDKKEIDIYCNLTEQQAALYQDILNQNMDNIVMEEGINRKGNIFKLITSLKQICNHPAQYTKSKIIKLEDSGKLLVLINTLENILSNNEKTLIVTQYVQMGKIIQNIINEKFDCNALFLHGSLSRNKRDELVDKFQNNSKYKVFIISLKAGGTGLNLTAAQNVIHYDLWWNPAVENQATDRTYRIGQDKNVMVYRFITSGTFEENINQMIKEKEELANKTITKNTKFITELSDNELKEIFKLNRF